MKSSNQLAARGAAEKETLPIKIIKEGALIGLVALCLYLVMSLLSYSPADPGWSRTGVDGAVHNAGGAFGAWLADVFLSLFGYVSYLFPVLIGWQAWRVFRDREQRLQLDWVVLGLRCVGFVLVMLSATAMTTMYYGLEDAILPFSHGGILGSSVATGIRGAFSYTGGALILVSVFLFGMTVFTDLSWLRLMDSIGGTILRLLHLVGERWLAWRKRRGERQTAEQVQKVRRQVIESHAEKEKSRIPPRIEAPPQKPRPSPRVEKEKQKSLFESEVSGALPPINLLDSPDKSANRGFSRESLEAMSRLLELKLKDFNIEAEVVSVMPGPVVTRFELQPAPGVKVSRITNLAKDLARSLAVISVRVVEVIPGKSVVGIEIPNEDRQMVRLGEVLASSVYENSKSNLTLALGHDIAGEPIVADLARMPHLLVAGTTGSGKSVGVNAMLLSLLYKSTPKQVRLILVDPKMLELSVYEGIPHLLTPVITDMKDAANGLRWSVGEMERRYKLMAALGVRNLAGFNRKVEDARRQGEPLTDPLWNPDQHFEAGANEARAPELETLPCIVVVIDEFADMMMIVGKKVEQLIARIAQKARAAGIHLILATQRPSVDVITGLIKANVPTRIAFQVSSKVDTHNPRSGWCGTITGAWRHVVPAAWHQRSAARSRCVCR